MADFNFDDLKLERIIDSTLLIWADVLVQKIKENTPRDKKRLPVNTINRKDWEAPKRGSHYKPLMINWNWYEWVTWNLKRSIWLEKKCTWQYRVWVKMGVTEEYARHLEFWTKFMEKRSFLVKWLTENVDEITKIMKKNFNILLKK